MGIRVYHSIESYEAGPSPVATIGTFDGLHIGHRKILARLREAAQQQGGETVLISFHPHPRQVLFPEKGPLPQLQSLDEKIAGLEALGLDKLLLIPFTLDFAQTTSVQFIEQVLVQCVKIHTLVIGHDHHFGKNRSGGIEELSAYAPRLGYQLEQIPAQMVDDAQVSSTKIRQALLAGDPETAARYLGYAYRLQGEVMHGEKMGRKLGFPTANLRIADPLKLIPANGVYFVRVSEAGKGPLRFGLMNIGVKPTVGEHTRGVEVWLYDFDGDLYGRMLELEVLHYLRPELKFNSLDELIAAMQRDKSAGEALIARYT